MGLHNTFLNSKKIGLSLIKTMKKIKVHQMNLF